MRTSPSDPWDPAEVCWGLSCALHVLSRKLCSSVVLEQSWYPLIANSFLGVVWLLSIPILAFLYFWVLAVDKGSDKIKTPLQNAVTLTISSPAYTDEVVTAIKHSRRVIIVLSPAYVSGPSIFELQAAVNCALEDKRIKLVLIKFQDFQEPETLPPVVKKALRILPVITWKSSISAAPHKKFWKYMHYHMPMKTAKKLENFSFKGFFKRLFRLV